MSCVVYPFHLIPIIILFELVTSARTDRLMRMDPSPSRFVALDPCPDCKMTFYCSAAHKAALEPTHKFIAMHEGLTQCALNRQINEDFEFNIQVLRMFQRSFSYIPERVKEKWEGMGGMSWEGEYVPLLEQEGFEGMLPMGMSTWIRAMSEEMSFPMTVLMGMEILYGKEDAWTRKETLVVHVGSVLCALSHYTNSTLR